MSIGFPLTPVAPCGKTQVVRFWWQVSLPSKPFQWSKTWTFCGSLLIFFLSLFIALAVMKVLCRPELPDSAS